jgi:hypothetical protein
MENCKFQIPASATVILDPLAIVTPLEKSVVLNVTA